MEKTRSFLLSHKTFLVIFGSLLLYEVCVVGRCTPWHVGENALTMYALDYSFGFADKILPGAFYHLFFRDIAPENISLFSSVLLVLFFFALAVFLEKLYRASPKNNRVLCALVIWFFLTGPATFSVFVKELGVIEVFWFYIAAVFVLLVSRRQLAPLTVILCVAALMVNMAAILVVVPMFCILLLYRLSFETEKSGRVLFFFTFFFCVIVSLPLFVYLVVYSKENMIYSYDEFHAMMTAKGAFPKYPEYFFYPEEMIPDYFPFSPGEEKLSEFLAAYHTYVESAGFSRLINFFIMQRQAVRFVGTSVKLRDLIIELTFLSPLLGLMFFYFISRLKEKTENKLRRFVFFCIPALFVLDLLSGILFSIDNGKWISYGTLVFFGSFIYVFYYEKEHVAAYLQSRLRGCPPAIIGGYALIYAFTFFSFY